MSGVKMIAIHVPQQIDIEVYIVHQQSTFTIDMSTILKP